MTSRTDESGRGGEEEGTRGEGGEVDATLCARPHKVSCGVTQRAVQGDMAWCVCVPKAGWRRGSDVAFVRLKRSGGGDDERECATPAGAVHISAGLPC